jgi:hypothetical protein
MQEIPVEPKPVEEAALSVTLKRFEDKVYRSFSEDEEETYHIKPCKDYL